VNVGALEFEPMYLPHLLSLEAVIVGSNFTKVELLGHGQYTEQVGTSTNLVY
jgi:hypothetical protein